MLTVLTLHKIASKICLQLYNKLVTPGKTHAQTEKQDLNESQWLWQQEFSENTEDKVQREDIRSSGNDRFCNIRQQLRTHTMAKLPLHTSVCQF